MAPPTVTANVPFLTRLLADGFVLWVVRNKDTATQTSHANLWTQLATAAIALNNGDAATASTSLGALAAGITDPAQVALINDGMAIAENNLTVLQKILGATAAGTVVATLINGFWQHVIDVASKYIPAAPVAGPAAPPTT